MKFMMKMKIMILMMVIMMMTMMIMKMLIRPFKSYLVAQHTLQSDSL